MRLIVGESIELPENDLSLLVEKCRQNLLLAADSLSGHRRSHLGTTQGHIKLTHHRKDATAAARRVAGR